MPNKNTPIRNEQNNEKSALQRPWTLKKLGKLLCCSSVYPLCED